MFKNHTYVTVIRANVVKLVTVAVVDDTFVVSHAESVAKISVFPVIGQLLNRFLFSYFFQRFLYTKY